MGAAATHLFLPVLQEVENSGFIIEFGIDWQCLDKHAHGIGQLFVVTPIIYCGEERHLLVVELGKQESVCGGEEGASEDAVLVAEGVNTVHRGGEHVCQAAFAHGGHLAVGQQGGEHVSAVEVVGVPCLSLLEGRRLAVGLLTHSHLCECHRFLFGSQAVISLVDGIEHQFHRCAVNDDVVIVDEQVKVGVVAQDADAEQAVAAEVEGCHQRGFFCGDVIDVLNGGCPRFQILCVDALYGFSVVVERYPGEKGGVGLYRCLDSFKKPFLVEALVERVQIWKVIADLSAVLGAFHINTVLRLA